MATAVETQTSKRDIDTSFHTLQRERAFRNPSKSHKTWPEQERIVAPHVGSFDALFSDNQGEGLLDIGVRNLRPRYVYDGKSTPERPHGNVIELRLDRLTVGTPMITDRAWNNRERRIYPDEAREGLFTYGSRMSVRLSWSVNGGEPVTETRDVGMLPIMLRSQRCNLRGLSPAELVNVHEEPEEMGGYFIVNGNEKVVRLLIAPRRNHATAINRNSFTNRGSTYTQHGVQIRGVRDDESACTNTLHYLTTGAITLRFSWRKAEYMIPVVLVMKALVDGISDKTLFSMIVRGSENDTYITDRAELLLATFKPYKLYTRKQCLRFLGEKFRVVLQCPLDWDDEQIGQYLIDQVVLVHLQKPEDKLRMLTFMCRKLYALVSGECVPDNPDSPQNQEVLLPGSLFSMIIKEKLDEYLLQLRNTINQDIRRSAMAKRPIGFDVDDRIMTRALGRTSSDIGGKLEYFLATGNLVSPSGLDLQQTTGFVVVADKLNYTRFIAHFRAIHRGAFFAELKTTTVRKLLPEAWGFLCPVHTPDGAPCGLLNHLAHECRVVTETIDASGVPELLYNHGVVPATDVDLVPLGGWANEETAKNPYLCVQLDGRILGYIPFQKARELTAQLRIWRSERSHGIPRNLEIGLVPVVPNSHGTQYPGLYLFSSRSRFMRDVKLLQNGKNDSVGSFEQVYLDIACRPNEIDPTLTTHVEWSPTHVLSVLANMTPFSDFNQSPRNMYQCQMSKQTMGTPSTALSRRTDNKMYRLYTGQTPVVRPQMYNKYGMDAYPNGTNAIVAVISYTGYDMEDAMILNKSAFERGFGNGVVYKSHIVDLKSIRGSSYAFMLGPDVGPRDRRREAVDTDGLPFIGRRVKTGDVLCTYYDVTARKTINDIYKGDETAYVDEVRFIGSDSSSGIADKVHIKLRIPRPPIIGDKFSSRHGQKGVCSQKYPAVDLPFTESGMQPDVIINPHAFPSRMTIGMFVESMGGKAGALYGLAQDATPFTYSENDTPVDFFGQQLASAGYNYYGSEPMYSGITGQELRADIYIGVVYYQRLRHMVADKWQVRTTGPVDPVTYQPVKGRKRGGGIRFGEMERDALLAHGTAFLLQDRLMNCSDYSTAWVCRSCGSMTSLGYDLDAHTSSHTVGPHGEYCRICRRKHGTDEKKATMDIVAIPFVLRLLIAELSSMGIGVNLGVN